jgi:predicted DNA-binding antitoxin AbrB/MazE fold protein
MSDTIEATFDGTVFRPLEPVPLAPNTAVRLTVEPLVSQESKQGSFLKTAGNLKLEGPADWSANIDRYLYGQEDGRGS